MIYLLRLVIWLMIIVFISWGIHKILKKHISNKRLKPFIGVIAFLVIILTPITIAKVAQLYYCWKYQPLYKIIKPLGDDFKGFYGVDAWHWLLLNKKYNEIPTTDVPIWKNNKKVGYVRYYFLDKDNPNCDIKETKEYAIWLKKYKQNKCIAKKIIPESEVSRYEIGGKALEDERLFLIPGVAYVDYHKSPIFTDRKTGEIYAWGAFISTKWDLYGAFNWWGGGLGFYCSYDFNLRDKLIKQVGEKHGK